MLKQLLKRGTTKSTFSGVQSHKRTLHNLAYEIVPNKPASKTAIVLHGLCGGRNNWNSFVKKLNQLHPDWKFLLVDLRNHGDSSTVSFPAPHSMANSANDIVQLLQYINMTSPTPIRPDAIIGHSLGSKVAWKFVEQVYKEEEYWKYKPKQLWLLDPLPGTATIKEMAESKLSAVQVLEFINTLPMPLPSRKALVDEMKSRGFDDVITAWMTTNLTFTQDGYRWKFNSRGVHDMFLDYIHLSMWDFLKRPPRNLAVHLVKAEKSDRWTPEVNNQLKEAQESSPQTNIHSMNASHWVHYDNPEGLIKLLSQHLFNDTTTTTTTTSSSRSDL
eukprot:TRINITY_DN1065_c1_g4_i2.p1 TRINITY_DN1065_c1_g4~~TRINITY_DN1065_c1_g4_i2.p1  ORF type:complete len:330 (-),score=86.53 TRINITY_DN1065_c1_g4_i2:26-1015(-)